MAWTGVILGMIAGLCAAVAGYTGGLHLWICLLTYPAAGSAVALLATAFLYWRSEAGGPGGRLPPASPLAAA